MGDESRPHLPSGTRIGKFQIVNFIGAGGFGDIYTADEIGTPNKYAIKIEYRDAEKQGLKEEIHFMKQIQGSPLLPVLISYGSMDNFRFLVMELLGPSVSNLRRTLPGHHYTQYSINALAFHMLTCIEELHKHGITHRDVKPGNFLIRPSRTNPVCLIDFGLSKPYINPETHEHIPYSKDAGFTGTCRYASPHAHDSIELSRRDDLYSWFYSVIELAEGRVPWPGSKDKELTISLKKSIPLAELCKSLQPQYIEIYRIIHSLTFQQEPDYDHIKSLISDAISVLPKPHLYDWETKEFFQNTDISKISQIPLEMKGPPSLNDEPFHLYEHEVSGGCTACYVI